MDAGHIPAFSCDGILLSSWQRSPCLSKVIALRALYARLRVWGLSLTGFSGSKGACGIEELHDINLLRGWTKVGLVSLPQPKVGRHVSECLDQLQIVSPLKLAAEKAFLSVGQVQPEARAKLLLF